MAESLEHALRHAEEAELASLLAAADPEELRPALRAFIDEALAGQSGLQRHLLPFDTDANYRLSWPETFNGFRDVGLASTAAFFVATATHIVMGIPSSDSLTSWQISLDNAEKARHAADTGLYSETVEGKERKLRVARLVKEFDSSGDGRLSPEDLQRIVEANIEAEGEREGGLIRRTVGGIASRLEFGVLMKLAGSTNEDGSRYIDAQTIQDLYGGALMYSMLSPEKLAAAIVRARDVEGDGP